MSRISRFTSHIVRKKLKIFCDELRIFSRKGAYHLDLQSLYDENSTV